MSLGRYTAKKIIEAEEISLTYHSIIYELLDDVKAGMSGLLDPIIKEEIVETEVLEVLILQNLVKSQVVMLLKEMF